MLKGEKTREELKRDRTERVQELCALLQEAYCRLDMPTVESTAAALVSAASTIEKPITQVRPYPSSPAFPSTAPGLFVATLGDIRDNYVVRETPPQRTEI